AIYQIAIGFKKSYAAYLCENEMPDEGLTQLSDDIIDDDAVYEGDYYYDDYYYYGDDYEWEQRDNPCHSSYYTSARTIRKNVLASDFGLIAKSGNDGTTTV